MSMLSAVKWRNSASSGLLRGCLKCKGGEKSCGPLYIRRFVTLVEPVKDARQGQGHRRPSQDIAAKFHSVRNRAFATWTEITGAAMAE
jgi:hypothetical protein